MNKPMMTARHEQSNIEIRSLCGDGYTLPGVELTVTWEQGDDSGALAALDRAYADVKRQITGMTTLIHAEHAEDR